uniref:Uncharacterized protein n=1 Tax=Siphoviridae sp. ctzyE57 TaxID=2827982 RepID=A0A8S5SH06_9CAUD|nr:MAG TPA: hypothetical protein [Siphoviridae sp. ctzyE57]
MLLKLYPSRACRTCWTNWNPTCSTTCLPRR